MPRRGGPVGLPLAGAPAPSLIWPVAGATRRRAGIDATERAARNGPRFAARHPLGAKCGAKPARVGPKRSTLRGPASTRREVWRQTDPPAKPGPPGGGRRSRGPCRPAPSEVSPPTPAAPAQRRRAPALSAGTSAPGAPDHGRVGREHDSHAPLVADEAAAHLVHHVGDGQVGVEVVDDDRPAPAAPEAGPVVGGDRHLRRGQPVTDARSGSAPPAPGRCRRPARRGCARSPPSESSRTPPTSPPLAITDWMAATDRALPCPLAAGISARRQGSVQAASAASGGLPSVRSGHLAGSPGPDPSGGGGMTLDTRPNSAGSRPMWKSAPSGPATAPGRTRRPTGRSPGASPRRPGSPGSGRGSRTPCPAPTTAPGRPAGWWPSPSRRDPRRSSAPTSRAARRCGPAGAGAGPGPPCRRPRTPASSVDTGASRSISPASTSIKAHRAVMVLVVDHTLVMVSRSQGGCGPRRPSRPRCPPPVAVEGDRHRSAQVGAPGQAGGQQIPNGREAVVAAAVDLGRRTDAVGRSLGGGSWRPRYRSPR